MFEWPIKDIVVAHLGINGTDVPPLTADLPDDCRARVE